MTFLPNPVIEQEKPKFDPRGIPGVFMGWKMNPGGRWAKEYLVASLADFEQDDKRKTNRLTIHTVKEITHDPKRLNFPLREAHDINR